MRQWTIDAFTSQPFRGNPACVVEPFEAWPDEAWMQALAMENNQAETAFLLRSDKPGRYGLRWFTPLREAPLCGHATLAAAHALWAEMGETSDMLSFQTLSGELRVRRSGDGYEMDFPADPPRRIEPPRGLAEALGVEPVEVWAGAYLIAVLPDETAVRAAAPGGEALMRMDRGPWEHGSVVVAAQGQNFDVVSRFFAPGFGIPEDPVTGSAHCILAPLFAEKLGKTTLSCHQAYPGRGGEVECELAGDRVLLRGRAVTVIEARLRA
ncbi:PhzF family phenazine biosynthesis protein [Brevundimonas sp. 2R-24]|uniref:PhzF family phenazine biosynthesis protein n=1 Tax=Peiella sedimenti TaxID=3061083 RepID=A0ABT8SLZ6_9CAUL|nr:PhzF family phenazine biosynthesis protein [Caulobacteraceae bacterium XZ-24]